MESVSLNRQKIRSLIVEEINRSFSRCKVREIDVDNIRITVEIADTDTQRNKGLMFRDRLDENAGMLFLFPESRQLGFWMKNTVIPLSIAFISRDGVITNIESMTPGDLNSKFSNGDAMCALEMNSGWFRRNNILPGSRVSI